MFLVDSRRDRQHSPPRPDHSAARRTLHYAFYDWSREMPRSKRIVTWLGLFLQGYALYVGITRSLAWPSVWPRDGPILFSWLLFAAGGLFEMYASDLKRAAERTA